MHIMVALYMFAYHTSSPCFGQFSHIATCLFVVVVVFSGVNIIAPKYRLPHMFHLISSFLEVTDLILTKIHIAEYLFGN